MIQRGAILALVLAVAASAAAMADVIRKTQGQVNGDVVQVTAQEVTIKQGATETKVPVNQIEVVRYSDEPSLLNTVRTAIDAGRNEDAVATLERIKVDDLIRPEIKQDFDFYTALAKARLALAGTDQQAIVDAGVLMLNFTRNHPQSYHYYRACEIVGDLLVAAGKYGPSQEFYGRLAQAPWPDYQMRAGVATGRALLAEGKTDEALAHFDKALALEARGPVAEKARLAATLGRARCLAEAGKADEAVELVEGIIAQTNPEETELQAQAYNTLGVAHVKAGRTQDALLAFLHVDVLYFKSPNEHIEALQNLVDLWTQVQKPERADEAATILRERYNRSPRSG